MGKYLLISIVFLAFLIRIAGIDFIPPSLNWDEVSHGYNAYSILETGKDEWGDTLPIIFRAYGDYKLPVYIYLTAISEFFLGLTALSVRLPSVLAGTGAVIFTYLLVNQLFRNKKPALLAAFLVAVEPWSFFLSRIGVEANVALFLIISGTYFFLRGLQSNKYLLLSVLLFGLSVWTYNSARIFVPLFLLALHIIYRKKIKLTTYYILLATVFLLPMFVQLFNPAGQARYNNVAILDEGAIASIENSRNNSQLGQVLTRLVYNRPVYFLTEFTKNYISHFSPEFLFINGGSHYQFNIPGYGLLHVISLPFFYLGLFLLIKNYKNINYKLLLIWLLIAPVASSLTREAPHTLRSILMLPVPMIVTSRAVTNILKSKQLYIYTAVVIIFFGAYLIKYMNYRQVYSSSWQFGYEQTVGYIKTNYDNYDKIIMTKKYGEPHEFLLYHYPWDPIAYIQDANLVRFYQSNWYWVDGFDKFYFVNDWQIPDSGEEFVLESGSSVDCKGQKCLLVTSPGKVPGSWTKLINIDFLNGEGAFEIYEN